MGNQMGVVNLTHYNNALRKKADLEALLRTAQERLRDMLKMDDGQAFSEADKFLKRLDAYLENEKKLDVV